MSFPIDTLNRWQRMRFVSLALACGASPSIISSSSATTTTTTDAATSCCLSCKADIATGVHRLEPSNPGRSLVDKHYDSIAHAATQELLVPIFAVSMPEGAGGPLVFQIARAADSSSASSLCLLCEIAQQCNAPVRQDAGNQEEEEKQDENKKKKQWWWNAKFDPDYINMETGDIGGDDPVDEMISRPLSMWAENCRFVLGDAAARVATQQKRKKEEKQEEVGSRIQILEGMSAELRNQNVVAHFDIDDQGAISAPAPAPLPEHTAGFNRSKIRLSEGFRAAALQSVLKNAESLSRFLCEKMLSILSLVVQRGINIVAANTGEEKVIDTRNMRAALFFYIFSDARRRQANSAQQQTPTMMVSGGGGGGSSAAAMMMMSGGGSAGGGGATTDPSVMAALSMLNGGAPTSAAPAAPTAEGGPMIQMRTGGDRASGVASMLAALQASAQQQRSAAGGVSPPAQQQQQQQPPPPFPLPLSLLEEALIVCPSSALAKELCAVRSRVEIEPHLPQKEEAVEEEELTEEQEMEAALRAASPPSYAAEFSHALLEMITTQM